MCCGEDIWTTKDQNVLLLAFENNLPLIPCCLFSIQITGKTTFRWKTLILWWVVACREIDPEERMQLAESQKHVYSWALLQGYLQCWRGQFFIMAVTSCNSAGEGNIDSIWDTGCDHWVKNRNIFISVLQVEAIDGNNMRIYSWGSIIRSLITFEFGLIYWRYIHWCKFLEGLKLWNHKINDNHKK